ncbi:MAG: aminotransferase class V-fold PLP-dependent enzyme [Rhizobiaceae bacterium]|nr:aminotransferase class V-fold PLP-dependent enzyme [Rhizobiaceae bacterium]
MSKLPSQRQLFDIPEDVAFFNSATNSPLLRESRKRLMEGVTEKSHPWDRTADRFFTNAETIRTLSARLFGGDADGYAIIPAASYGISTAARAIEPSLGPGDLILLIDEEFPSNVLPWQRTANETGAEIKTIPTPQNGNWTEAILNGLDSKVKVVALSSCHWTNGAYIDLEAIGAACREVNAIFVIDATQSLGAMPFSIENVRPDFLIAAGYKWLLCPYGFGILYVSEEWRDARPLEEVWLARQNAEDFSGLVKYSNVYMPGARRFDMGEKCIPTILPGAIAALEQIEEWGIENIADTLSSINQTIIRELEGMGFDVPYINQRCPHMFGAVLPNGYQGDLVSELMQHGVHLSKRGNAIRFSPHLHVTEKDVRCLLEALRKSIVG